MLKISFNQQLPNLSAQFLVVFIPIRSYRRNELNTLSKLPARPQIDETALYQALKAGELARLHNPAGLSSAYIRKSRTDLPLSCRDAQMLESNGALEIKEQLLAAGLPV